MKKILLMTLLLMIVLSPESYGAASEDMNVYVRQDVFDAKMEALFARLDAKIDSWGSDMDRKIARLDAKIDSLGSDMDKKIAKLDAKIDSAIGEIKGDIKALDARVSNIENNVSWWIGGLTLFLTGLALVPLVWTIVEKLRKPLFTLEDVRRLIEENNAKLSTMFEPRAA